MFGSIPSRWVTITRRSQAEVVFMWPEANRVNPHKLFSEIQIQEWEGFQGT